MTYCALQTSDVRVDKIRYPPCSWRVAMGMRTHRGGLVGLGCGPKPEWGVFRVTEAHGAYLGPTLDLSELLRREQ